jgi:tetratricopeptide repeat protein
MIHISFSRAVVCVIFAAVSVVTLPAQSPGAPQQNPSSLAQSTAKQRYNDEEKKLLADVQSAESSDAKPVDLTKTLASLARFYQSHNRKVELSPVLDRELASAEKSWPPDDHELRQTLEQIAGSYALCNQRDRAEQLMLRILDVDAKAQGLNSQAVASDLLALGRFTMYKTDSPEAENYFMKALAIDQVRKDDTGAAEALRALSTMARIQKNPEKADALLDRALESLRLNADRNAMYISMILTDRANAAMGRKDISAAIDYTQQSLEIDERRQGNNNPFLVGRLTFLADLYMQRGDIGPAESSLQRALQIADLNEKDAQHLSKVNPLLILARLDQREKKYAESEATIKSAMALQSAARGTDDPSLARASVQLAELYHEQQKFPEAEAQYRRTIALADSDQTGIVSHELPAYLAEFAFFLRKQNRNDEAEKLLQRAREIAEKRRAAVQNQTPVDY